MTERLDYWRQQLERIVTVGYPVGIVLATMLYLSSRDHTVLKVSILAGAAGVLILVGFTVLEASLRRRDQPETPSPEQRLASRNRHAA